MSLTRILETNSEGKVVEISDEVQQLLQSLPKECAWGGDLYQYQGTWLFGSNLEALLFSQSHFQASDTDALLVTQPKAGTTWLKSLVFAITQRDRYTTSDPNHPLHISMPHALVPSFEVVYNHNSNPNLSNVPSPRLLSTHVAVNLLPDSVKNTNCRIIYLCRNPRDVFVSGWHYTNKLLEGHPLPFEESFDFFCKGIAPNGPIYDHTLGYWNLSLKAPQKVLFLTYEDLKRDTTLNVKKIAAFLGCPFSSKEEKECVAQEIAKLCSFDNLSNLEVNKSGIYADTLEENKNYFRKGEVGDWVNYLTPSMVKMLDNVMEEKLLGSGFSFSY